MAHQTYSSLLDWGIGFMCDFPTINISVNDQIYWRWTSPDHIKYATYNIIQTQTESSVPDYSGFYSGAKTSSGNY